jgi:hypothetical protein
MTVTEPFDGSETRAFWGGLCAGGAGLASLGIIAAVVEPRAPISWLMGAGTFLLAIFLLALVSALIRWLAERRWGEARLEGAWWTVMRAKILFSLASLTALPILGVVALLAWVLGSVWAGLLGRALLTLLIGTAFIGIAGSMIANFLSLLAPRQG